MILVTLEAFLPYVTEFDDGDCNLCAPNKQTQRRKRECVWFEGSHFGECIERRTSNNTEICSGIPLQENCPPNGTILKITQSFKKIFGSFSMLIFSIYLKEKKEKNLKF